MTAACLYRVRAIKTRTDGSKNIRGAMVVRGWVTYADFGVSIGLTAHSVVRDRDGQLFDITPLGNERDRVGMWFVPHVGTEQEFKTMQQSNVFMRCPVKE